MKLSREQIKYIENRLRDEGIKYWDVRIEMLDHVVLDVEKRTALGEQFKDAVQHSFAALGWKENFTGGGFDAVFQKTLTNYSKTNKKNLLTFYKKIFTNLKYLTITVLFWIYLFMVYPNMQLFKYSMLIVLIIFAVAFIGFVLKYNVFKSTRLNSLLNLVFLPILLLNILMYWPKLFFGYDKLSNTYLFLVCGIATPFLVFGIYFLYQEFKSTEKIYRKLIE